MCRAFVVCALALGVIAAPARAGFAPLDPLPAGSQPFAVAVADFDADTRPDLAVANEASDDVTILLGQPGGGFAEEAGSPLAVGDTPAQVTAADLNGDDRPDLAVANYRSDTVTLLLRQPDGGFAPMTGSPFAVGPQPADVDAADFNGDGRTDLAVVEQNANGVTILLGTDTGFVEELGSPFGTGSNPFAAAVADFDGDDRPDLAITNSGSANLTILLRQAGGGFAEEAGSPIAVGTNPLEVAAANFNSDGRPDLAVANFDSDTVTVLLRQAGGGFVEEGGSPIAVGDGPYGVVAAKLDRDGRTDLAVSNEFGDEVAVLLRQAGGGFTAAPSVPTGGDPLRLAAADLDGDGRVDLVTPDHDGTVSVLQGTIRTTITAGPADGDSVSEFPSFQFTADEPGTFECSVDGGPFAACTSEFQTPPLGEGAHTFSVRATDADGRVEVRPPLRTFRMDATPSPPPTVPPGCSPPTAGRVALLRAEDTPEDSAGTHDGLLQGGYRAGFVGRAFSLAGDADHVSVPDAADLDVTGDLTLDAWVQIDDTNFGTVGPSGVGGDRVVFWDAPTYAFWIEGDLVTADAAPLRFKSGGGLAASDDLAWEKDRWYHLALTRAGNEVTFYRDGATVGTATTDDAGPASPIGLALGAALENGGVFNPIKGGLDEAEVWNRALSADEVKAVYDSATRACEDATAPDTVITAGPEEGSQTGPAVTFEFVSSEPGSTFSCTLTSNPGTLLERTRRMPDCQTPLALDLEPGTRYRFSVAATDAAGNTDPTPAERNFTALPRPPVNTAAPKISPIKIIPNTYICDPGTWVGSDGTYEYEWQRLVPDGKGGYTPRPEATGRTYRAASPTRAGVELNSWLFRCVVTAHNAGGATEAASPPTQLDPVYDPSLQTPAYGNIRIRGIDVFESVQPESGAEQYGYDPRERFTNYPGGGTPTDWLSATAVADSDPQDVVYRGLTLDRNQPITAVVYVDTENRDGRQPVDVTLTLRQGSFERDLGTKTVTSLRSASTPYVTANERGLADFYGVQFDVTGLYGLPGGNRFDLVAKVKFAAGDTVWGLHECDSTRDCGLDDRFTLRGIPRDAGYSNAEIIVQSLNLFHQFQADGTPSPAKRTAPDVFQPVRQVFPDPSGTTLTNYAANVDVTKLPTVATDAAYCKEDGKPIDGKHCMWKYISEQIAAYRRDNPGRTVKGGSITRNYDVLMGVQGYADLGFEQGGTVDDNLSKTVAWPSMVVGCCFNRPLTAVAHEFGHVMTAPHADTACGGGTGGEVGELWPPDFKGRLQGVMFRRDGAGPVAPEVDSLAPNGLYDFMSYCRGGDEPTHWISPFNYNRYAYWFDAVGRKGLTRGSRVWPAAQARVAARAYRQATVPRAIAIGTLDGASGTVDRILQPDGDDDVPASVEGSSFRLRSVDDQGRTILDAGVAIERSTMHGTAAGVGVFTGPVAPGAASVQLVHGEKVLAALVRSAPPTVRLIAPTRGVRARRGVAVRWAAQDPDGDQLETTIEFSADGGRTWRTVQMGASRTRTRVPQSMLTGSRRARVRVTVSDGFNEAVAISPQFRADGPPPVAEIIRPTSLDALSSAAPAGLLASATDDARRRLRGRALTWFAGRRRLGTGEALSARLPAGRVRLRLVARDRAGRTTTVRRTLTVHGTPLKLLRLDGPLVVGRSARRVTLTVAASKRAILRAGGGRYAVGPHARRIRVRLPRRPASGLLRVPVTLRAGGQRVRGRFEVKRGGVS